MDLTLEIPAIIMYNFRITEACTIFLCLSINELISG